MIFRRFLPISLAYIATMAMATGALADPDAWNTCEKGWEQGGDLGSPHMASGGFVGGKKHICWDTDGTADSTLVAALRCDNLDMRLWNLTDGDEATNVSVIPRICPDGKDQDPDVAGNQSTDATNCSPIVADLATATNNEALGYRPGYIYFDVVTNTDSDKLRIDLFCNGL